MLANSGVLGRVQRQLIYANNLLLKYKTYFFFCSLLTMCSKVFEYITYYKGLEDAIAAVSNESDDEANYDLAIVPPPSSVVTDEEEEADEDMVISTL